MARLASMIRAALGSVALLADPAAHAQWMGSLSVSSDNIQRGVSLSEHEPSAQGTLGWRHGSGWAASLGLATISREQFAGSAGYQLKPQLGWSGAFAEAWRSSVSLQGQIFPGALGAWFGSLPPAVQGRVLKPQTSDYGTLEVGASLGYGPLTLSAARALTDYLGLSAVETGPQGQRLIKSLGTNYIAADFDWPLMDGIAVNAGMGRLTVPNFDSLSYTDWRLGLTAQAWSLVWALQASGSNADKNVYRLPRRTSAGKDISATQCVRASVAWTF